MIAVLAAAALALAPGSTDPVPTPVLSERPLEWALVGVGPGARSLVVQPGWAGGCDSGDPIVRVQQGADALDVRLSILSAQGPEVLCPAIARVTEPQTVALDAPVDGRAIRGAGRATRAGFALMMPPPTPDAPALRIPRVTGLAVADARSALCAWGIRARSAARLGTVTGQRPRAGTKVATPAIPTPERCADLPAAPAARLLTR